MAKRLKECILCGQLLRRVRAYDWELYLMTGRLKTDGWTHIHAGPDEAQVCRQARAAGSFVKTYGIVEKGR